MRKVFTLGFGVVLAVSLAAPSYAAKPTKTIYASSSANAFWYSTEQVSRNTVRNTTWYLGVYSSTDGIFSDLYQDVETCRFSRRSVTCSYTSRYGASDLSDGAFTMDAEGLTAAHIEGTYVLEEYDSNGRLVGSTPTTAVADLEGIGDIQTNGGKSTYCDNFICIRTTFSDSFRQAEATGSVNGVDLGETYDAYLSNSSATEIDRLK